jgi:hypothetical protein
MFARAEDRENELQDITACHEAGCKTLKRSKVKGISRSHFTPNDRRQFYTPSTDLFKDFCQSLVDRYYLHDLIKQGWVKDVRPMYTESTPHSQATKKSGQNKKPTYFEIDCLHTVTNGDAFSTSSSSSKSSSADSTTALHQIRTYKARKVVVAVGNTNKPNIPPLLRVIPKESYPPQRMMHALEFLQGESLFPGIVPNLQDKNLEKILMELKQLQKGVELKRGPIGRDLRVLVVGGGLTSAQLVQLAIERLSKNADGDGLRRGVKVDLITKGKLKVKQFDLDLDWVGRNSGVLYAKFWAEAKPEGIYIIRFCTLTSVLCLLSYKDS